MVGALTNQECKRRLVKRSAATGRPIYCACSWDGEGVVLPRDPAVVEADYIEAKAIVEACIAEGERRYKTRNELWAELATLPLNAQEAWVRAVVICVGREFAKGSPDRAEEIANLTAWLLGEIDPAALQQLVHENRLDFETTTTAPEPAQ